MYLLTLGAKIWKLILWLEALWVQSSLSIFAQKHLRKWEDTYFIFQKKCLCIYVLEWWLRLLLGRIINSPKENFGEFKTLLSPPSSHHSIFSLFLEIFPFSSPFEVFSIFHFYFAMLHLTQLGPAWPSLALVISLSQCTWVCW